MGEIGTRENFVSQIVSQQIFTKYFHFDSTSSSDIIPSEKLVVRNNREIYSANNNYVRVSNIDPERTQFKLLSFNTSFSIESLLLNSSGTLLALIGANEISVVHLPNTIDYDAIVPVKVVYEINNIGGDIVKVVWQSVVGNDSSLVVLNDKSHIKCFDLSISSSVPQLAIDLAKYEQFSGKAVTSISFGSQSNLAGSLSLYIASSDSNIYCLYPFIPSQSRLVASKEAVEGALQESVSIVKGIEKKFTYDNLIDTMASPLTKAAISHYGFYKHLKDQFSSGVPLQSESRSRNDSPVELKRLKHSLPFDYEPKLQGPLFYTESSVMSDIDYVYSNADFSLLTSLVTNQDTSTLLYYHCQLKPLILRWTTGDMVEPTPEPRSSTQRKASVTKKTQEGYAKPKKGFGFVNLSDDDSEIEVDAKERLAEELEFLRLSRQGEEEEFDLIEFNELTTLAVDILPTIAPETSVRSKASIVKFADESSMFGLYVGDDLIIVKAGQWIKGIINEIYPGENKKEKNNSKSATYELVPCDNVHGFGYVQDTVTETGEYLIIYSESMSDNLKVVGLKTEVQLKLESKTPDPSESIQVKHEEPKQSLEELKAEVARVGSFNPTRLIEDINNINNPIVNSVESLRDVSQLSSRSLAQISAISSVAYKSFHTISSQVNQLQKSIKLLKESSELIITAEKIDKTDERVSNILKKQELLEKRLTSVKDKLYEFVLHERRSNSIPYSKAEKAWSREINSILSLLTKDTEISKSWTTKEKLYESQVDYLIEKFTTNSAEKDADSAVEKVKERVMEQLLVGLKLQLQRDEEVVNSTKAKLQSLVSV